MSMKDFPQIQTLENGSRCWSHALEKFRVKAYIPQGHPLEDIVNFGFDAPYLLVFEEEEMTVEEAAAYAEVQGLADIARTYSTSVVFVSPAGSWEEADESLFIDLVAESRIHQYHRDGVVISKNRFTGETDGYFIRGAIFRTHLFGRGRAADYIARHCLKTLQGLYLWGPGEITPTTVMLENLSVIPAPSAVIFLWCPQETAPKSTKSCASGAITCWYRMKPMYLRPSGVSSGGANAGAVCFPWKRPWKSRAWCRSRPLLW